MMSTILGPSPLWRGWRSAPGEVGERPYWESSKTHHPHDPPKVFERVARMMLSGSDAAWRPPWGISFEHRVEDQQEFVGRGNERDFERFAGRTQA
jgi:hypothetical protein